MNKSNFQLNTFNEMAKFDKSVLEKYGITGTTEVLYNPSYEVLFNEETRKVLRAMKRVTRLSLVLST